MTVEEKLDLARKAAAAALAYDAAIQRYAEKGQSWVGGDDLDALYDDWITKAQALSEALE